MIMIFSSARSGSTWLAKILDSHPDTLYLHEPDIVDRGDDLLPFWFENELTERELENARLYLTRLCAQRNLRAVGTRPVFPKNYRNALSSGLRTSMIYSGKLIGRGFPGVEGKIAIPDLSLGAARASMVIKSVSALGRAEALLRGAGRPIQPVLLLRNPCAIVQSFLDGVRMGAMSPPPGISKLLKTRSARRLNADGVLDQSDMVDRLAWGWILANAEAHAAITAADGIVVHYESLTADSQGASKRLFAQLGLDWSATTAAFLTDAAKGDGGYYSLSRDPKSAADRWRAKMDPAIFARVRDIVCRHPLGREYFPDDR